MKRKVETLVLHVQFENLLKYFPYIFLLLNIYGNFSFEISAQKATLTIKAEKPLSEGLIDSLQLPEAFEDYKSIKAKTDTLNKTLQHMGYVDVELREIKKENDSNYVAEFHLGQKYRWIKIFYPKEMFAQKELNQISQNSGPGHFVVPIEALPSFMAKLVAIQNKKGNAFARLNLTEIEKDGANGLTASLFLELGTARTVDSIVIQGYEKFPKSFLRYHSGIKAGKTFDKKKLAEQSENLNSLGFVRAIKPPEALFRKDTTIVYFYLEKENNNLFDGILGFTTDEETQKLELNGYLNLELNNNLNYGEQLLLNYKADGKEQIQFRVKTVLPYLFKTPFGVGAELKIFKRDSSFVTTEQQLQINYQISPTSQTYIGYRGFDSSNLLDQIVAGNPIEDFKSKFFIAGAIYRKTQNRKMFPTKTYMSFDLGIGTREKKDRKEDQYRAEVQLSNIFQLNQKNSFFVQTMTSALFSDTHLINELFRFGGINSIRGFDENSIDASLFSVINTEYRYQFNEGVFAHSIIDIGYFENQILSLKQNLYSFGLGLGLTTQAGLFRFIVANGIPESQNFNFSNTKIHISLSSRF